METAVNLSRDSTIDLREIWKVLVVIGIAAMIALLFLQHGWRGASGTLFYAVGWIAVWRYGWWATHLARSQIYAHRVFPRLRDAADSLWNSGWRPHFLHFVVVTYRERPDITRSVLNSIVRETEETGSPARIYIGISDDDDERALRSWFDDHPLPELVEVLILRASEPGKRHALGLALRTMRRCGAAADDLAILMDGDSILAQGALQRCMPLFALRPNLGAVTTDEVAVVAGPKWIQDWYELRFAQRRLVMESHSLSRKVLTLTGRCSVYRAANVVNESFIEIVEKDSLYHWLWGSFGLLSGDDKSTWYWVLRSGQEMLYVPDALVFTIERIEGSAWERAKQNLLRWSGNMLRNSRRALALGPRRCGPFIWWCLLDQRLSIWTAFVGPLSALLLSVAFGAAVLAAYFVWVVATRFCVSLVLWRYGGRFSASFPFLLFGNQLATASIKLFLMFRIARQSWANRGNQRLSAGEDGWVAFRNAMATFVTLLYAGLFLFVISVRLGVVELR